MIQLTENSVYRYIYALFFTVAILTSCSNDIEFDEQPAKPVARFTYALAIKDNKMELKLVSKSLNAARCQWTVNNELESAEDSPQLSIPIAASYKVKLEVTDGVDTSVSEQTIFFTSPTAPPTIKGVSYSWWCDPISIYHNGNNFFSGVDSLGQQVIFRYNQDNNTLISQNINSGYHRDEHNSPAFIIHNEAILIAYTGHDEDQTIRLKKVDLNFENEGPTKAVTFPSSTSYTQLFKTDGRIFLTTRCIYQWYIAWSDDDGDTWSQPVIFMQKNVNIIPGAFYIRPVCVSADKIIVSAYNHPVNALDKLVLYYGEFNPKTGYFRSEKGDTLGNIYGPTGKGVLLEKLDTIWAATAGNTFRFLDLALHPNGNTVFLVASTQVNDYSKGDYLLLEHDHQTHTTSSIVITKHGNDLPHDTYWGGAYFVVNENHYWNNEIYLAREQSKTWYVEKYLANSSNVIFQQLLEEYVSKDNRTLSRPLPPIGSTNGGLAVVYQKGEYYGYPSYMNWRNMELIRVNSPRTATSIHSVKL